MHKNKICLLVNIAVLGFVFLPLAEGVRGQEKNSSSALMSSNLPEKKFFLELIPLEGRSVDTAKCQKTDAQLVHLVPGQKLLVRLNKKSLSYRYRGKLVDSATNYDVQADIIIDNWGGWENWILDKSPLEWKDFSSSACYNDYFYEAGNTPGTATIYFISVTYPTHYSSLHVIVDENLNVSF